MPIHDWTRVSAGLFHHFHHGWTASLSNLLNAGRLPEGYYALSEQTAAGLVPDVLAIESQLPNSQGRTEPGGLAVATAPPQARFISTADQDVYATRANRIAIRHPLGHVVAMIEIVSPGNKSSRTALRSFVEKSTEFLEQGIHLLVVDLFPPGPRDPQGIHKAIWDEIQEEPFELPSDQPLTVAAYFAGTPKTAYVEPVSVGEPLPSLPIFLAENAYVPAPLEESYQTTWAACPQPLRSAVEVGR